MKSAVLAMTLCLASCAAQPQVDPRVAQFNAWADVAQMQVGSGTMKHSEYYAEAYNRLSAFHDTNPERLSLMRGYAELIPMARAYEAGAISREQFDDFIRLQEQAQQERSAALEAQKQQAISDAVLRMESYLRDTSPPQLNQPVQTTCNRIGGTVRCTSR